MPEAQVPLLGSPSRSSTTLPCKILLSAVAIGLVTLFTLQATTTTLFHSIPHPYYLCSHSPQPAACEAIVSDVITSSGSRHPNCVLVLNSVIDKSLVQIEAATSIAVDILRRVNEPRQNEALADCIQLFDLSRDRLWSSVSAISNGAHTEARTWMSAVLANHVTCFDGLQGPRRSAMASHLDALRALASTSLAVLNAVSPSSAERDDVGRPVTKFPSWLSRRDRKLLEASSAAAIKANVVVAQDGTGNYNTVQDAINSAPNKSSTRCVIYVKNGVYKETVRIPKTKTNLMIVGDGMNSTIITGSLNVIDGSTTFNSATLAAVADGLILQDLCIENTAGPVKHQAVALRVGADQSVINRCRIDGYQDTLYTHSLRQFYRDCLISGTVDFIFGDAAVVFQNCNIMARRPLDEQQNTITAQGRTDPNENTATSIQNCRLVAGADLVPVQNKIATFLGRPWQQYSRTVVMQSYIGDEVDPKGWLPWSGDFALKTLYYGEYLNQGPGAGTSGRVNWTGYHVITDPKVASAFTVASLIQGSSWLPPTGVVFADGL